MKKAIVKKALLVLFVAVHAASVGPVELGILGPKARKRRIYLPYLVVELHVSPLPLGVPALASASSLRYSPAFLRDSLLV